MGSLATLYLHVMKGSRDLLMKFWDPSISRERLELETSDLACILHYDPISPQNANFQPILTGLRKFHVKKALTMAMLESRRPLIVIIAPWKLYSE